jgi:hypothetical protein
MLSVAATDLDAVATFVYIQPTDDIAELLDEHLGGRDAWSDKIVQITATQPLTFKSMVKEEASNDYVSTVMNQTVAALFEELRRRATADFIDRANNQPNDEDTPHDDTSDDEDTTDEA